MNVRDGRARMDVIVGIPACAVEVNGHPRHDTPARYAEAVLGGAGAVPILIPPLGEAELAVLDRIDGLLLPGSPSNVHPHQYDGGDSRTPELHDPARDATTLPLIRAAIARGMPVLAICRGIQELNVALGGTLHQQVHELDGHMDHRGGPGTLEQRYGPKHPIALSGELALIVGAEAIMVNSLHAPGDRAPGARPGGRGARRGRHHIRGGPRHHRARFRLRRAMAPGMGFSRQPGEPGDSWRVRRGVSGVSTGHQPEGGVRWI